MSKREVTEKLRNAAHDKYTIAQVAKLLRAADKDHDGIISKTEGFQEILKEMKITLNAQETRTALRLLNATEEGIKIDTFIETIAPEISDERVKSIEKAYENLQPDGSGNVKIEELANSLNKDGFVYFLGRKMSVSHFKDELSKSFDHDRDGVIQKGNFVSYFKEYSQYYQTDDEFTEFINSSWAQQ